MAGLLENVGAIAGGGFKGFRFGEQVKQEREKLKLEGEELRGEEDFRRQRIDVAQRGVGVREEEIKLQREKFKAEQERKQPIDFSQAVNQFPRSVKAELFSLAKATGKLDENNMIPADEAEDFREDIQDNSALMIRLANTGIKDFSDDIEALTARKAEILRKRGIAPSLGNNPTFIAGDKELAPLQAELDAAMQGKADYAGIKQHFEGVEEEDKRNGEKLTGLAKTFDNFGIDINNPSQINAITDSEWEALAVQVDDTGELTGATLEQLVFRNFGGSAGAVTTPEATTGDPLGLRQ